MDARNEEGRKVKGGMGEEEDEEDERG